MTTTQPTTATLDVNPSAEQQRELLSVQRTAFLAEGPPSAEIRLERVDRFMACILEYADEISDALCADFGNRPRAMNLMSDIATVLPEVTLIRENLREWMQEQEVPGSADTGTPTFVQTRPKGVVGIIGPWNFPVLLVIHPAIEALAAGNRIMIKFSEIPERTAEVFAKALATRMTPDEVVVVRGDVATASAFADLPFDHLIFTGSPSVGALVAQAAGKNLVPVTLELGGKNPVVVGADADIELAAARIAGVRMMNGGQICLCPDYVFVPRAQIEKFVDAYQQAIRTHFPTYLNHPGVVSIINERNFDRVAGLIDDAETKGARILTVTPEEESSALPDRAMRRIPPTILLNVDAGMKVASEEIFGPVIVVYPYDTVTEAIEYINTQPSPLAAYWFGSDTPEFREFLTRTTSGGVTRNDVALHWGIEGAPSGGIGRSGTGAYTGKIGFDTFSHQRTVAASDLPFGFASQVLPPVGDAEADAVRAALGRVYEDIRGRLGEA